MPLRKKGLSWKAAGMLLSSCCALILVLWQSGVIQHLAHTRTNGPGMCSVQESDSFGTRASSSSASNKLTKRPHIVLYAHNCCNKSRVVACNSALKHGFGSCGQFGLNDLHLPALSPTGYDMLTETGAYGAGYWLWKPLIIWQELLRAEEGNIVVYMHADSEVMSDFTPLFDLLDTQDVVGFYSGETETNGTKTDVLLMLNATDIRDTYQLYAGLILFRRSWKSLGFVSQWLTFCQDRRWMTDMGNSLLPSVLKGQNHPGYFFHRHDQALFSLLYKKWGFKGYPDKKANSTGAMTHPYPTFWQFHHIGKE